MIPASTPIGNNRLPPEAPALGASPAVYTAARGGQIIIAGGTVSQVRLSRDSGGAWTDLGFIAGTVALAPFDQIEVTYTVLPTTTFIPS